MANINKEITIFLDAYVSDLESELDDAHDVCYEMHSAAQLITNDDEVIVSEYNEYQKEIKTLEFRVQELEDFISYVVDEDLEEAWQAFYEEEK